MRAYGETLRKEMAEGTLLNLFIGPYDLSQALGVAGRMGAPVLLEKVEWLVDAARAAGKFVGIFADTPEAADRWKARGVRYLSYSVDVGIYAEACRALVRRLE